MKNLLKKLVVLAKVLYKKLKANDQPHFSKFCVLQTLTIMHATIFGC